jgi:hypothetical protein
MRDQHREGCGEDLPDRGISTSRTSNCEKPKDPYMIDPKVVIPLQKVR